MRNNTCSWRMSSKNQRKIKSKQADLISKSSGQQVASANAKSAGGLQGVADLRAQTEHQPPLWFSSFEKRLDTRFNRMDTTLARMERTLNRIDTTLNRMDTTVNGLRYLAMKSENEKKRSFHETVEPIPFLDGSNPADNLAAIGSVDDIQRMSKHDVLAYLHGYGIGCTNSESAVDLKVKLRAAVGLMSPPNLAVVFAPSGRTRGG